MTAAAEKTLPLVQTERLMPTAATPMDMMDRAIATGNVEIIGKMMDFQERYEKNQARKAFDAAIAEAKRAIKPVVRNRSGHNSKRYADFAAIASAVDPILSEHGLSYRFRTEQGDRINVTCVLSHRDGHSETTTLSGPADASGNKNAIQAIGSTLTYLQRYSLVQMLGLAASDDDDGKAGGAGEPITDQQATEISALIVKAKMEVGAFLKWAKVESVADIPAADYADVIASLNARIAKTAEAKK